MEKHFDECSECQMELLFWRRIVRAFQHIPMLSPPDNLTAELLKSLPDYAYTSNRRNKIAFLSYLISSIIIMLFLIWFSFYFPANQLLVILSNFINMLLSYRQILFWIVIGCAITIGCIYVSSILNVIMQKSHTTDPKKT